MISDQIAIASLYPNYYILLSLAYQFEHVEILRYKIVAFFCLVSHSAKLISHLKKSHHRRFSAFKFQFCISAIYSTRNQCSTNHANIFGRWNSNKGSQTTILNILFHSLAQKFLFTSYIGASTI